MLEVNLFDSEFIHTENLLGYITCSDILEPKKIKWINGKYDFNGITVFTDRYIDFNFDLVKSDLKIFWLLEPRAVRPYGYSKIIEIENKFDYILTYDSELLKRSKKYIKYVVGQSRVYEPKIYDKTKMVSMIASNKQITEGHRFRHEISNRLSKKYNIDMWGSGYKSFDSKLSPLSDYYFTVSVMNSKIDNFFTEVIVDNFMLGTIPIFWGCPNINEYFDERGIITFDTIDELDEILSRLTINDYFSRIEYIKNNFEIAKKYVSTDDIISDVLQKI
jgi:hypothetical protein